MQLFLLICTMCAGAALAKENYCDRSLCKYDRSKKHIGCKPHKGFASACGSDVEEVRMTDKLQKLIVEDHNKRRNHVALGRMKPFPNAAKMRKMVTHTNVPFHIVRMSSFFFVHSLGTAILRTWPAWPLVNAPLRNTVLQRKRIRPPVRTWNTLVRKPDIKKSKHSSTI